jgi:hypothetical protein
MPVMPNYHSSPRSVTDSRTEGAVRSCACSLDIGGWVAQPPLIAARLHAALPRTITEVYKVDRLVTNTG